MNSVKHARRTVAGQEGLTLIELIVALTIGSFLIIGAVTVYTKSRQSYLVNESIARVQDTATFAMDAIEADLRMASNWGLTSRGLAINGRSTVSDANPDGIAGIPTVCGEDWVLDLALPVDGDNNGYSLPCPTAATLQPDSDHVVVRRASADPVLPEAGKPQVQTSRVAGQVFTDGNVPEGFAASDSTTRDLLVSSYYVANDSDLIPGVPTLRRRVMLMTGGAMGIVDEEVAPGVENLQIQFGIDVDQDNTVDRYVNPGDGIYDPEDPLYVPGARIITARVWLVVRGIEREAGLVDDRTYAPGDVDLGRFSDQYRRMQVSKTILLRNARS